MTLKQAYQEGLDAGQSISQNILTGNWGKVPLTLEAFLAEVCQTEESSREFSPFEFLAKELNESRNPDRAWEDYERGIINGATKAYRSRA